MSAALGRYVPVNSWVHRLDARVKILATILIMVCLFMNYANWTMTYSITAILALIIIVLLYSCRLTIGQVLRSFRSLIFMIVFLLIVYLLVPTANPTLPLVWNLNGWKVYWDAFAQTGKILLRLMLMIMTTMILTSSTKPLDLTYAFEWYLAPLKLVRAPVPEISMMISIALRFIPTLLEDAERVMKAQASRGVDFTRGHLWRRITGITSLIIPLFVSSFLRSEELANAMECRGYDPRLPRTRYRKLRFHWYDLVAFLFFVALIVGCAILAARNIDLFALMGVSVL